jgi:23S rRNA pseudouridine1911/1915/1917 synthase
MANESGTAGRVEYVVTPDDAGERLDKVVAKAAGVSRQRAMALIEERRVRVDHRRLRKGDRAEAGARIEIELPEAEAPVPQPELPLAVVHEDPWLVAIDKPAGTSMHPLEAGETGTIANAVLARYPDVVGASNEERCPGLVHRLDRETSGIVLWSRRADGFENLRRQFADKVVEKRYYALVDGFVEGAGVLNVPLAHDPKNAARMVATPYPAEAEALKARPAMTRYKALGNGDAATLLEVEIPTGVMHQIRAHFAFVGHPVVGDALYGGRQLPGLTRHCLHAASIGFSHPDGSGEVRYAAPLPEDFLVVLRQLGIHPP